MCFLFGIFWDERWCGGLLFKGWIRMGIFVVIIVMVVLGWEEWSGGENVSENGRIELGGWLQRGF